MCFPLGARWSEEGLREYFSGQNPHLDHFSLSAAETDEVIAGSGPMAGQRPNAHPATS